MIQYSLRKLSSIIPALAVLTTLAFIMLRLAPGDFADAATRDRAHVTAEELQQVRTKYGLDLSPPQQYIAWVQQMSHGDLGTSFYFRSPVLKIITSKFPMTFELMIGATLLSVPFGVLAGVVGAVKRNSIVDYGLRLFVLTGITLPSFVVSILLLYFLLTIFDYTIPLDHVAFADDPVQNLRDLFWPILILAVRPAAAIGRLTRSQVLEVLREDYVRTAAAKGLSQFTILRRHVLPNAMPPLVGLLVSEGGGLLAGAVIVELIFVVPGLGRTLLIAIQNRDYPLVQGLVLLFGFQFILLSLAADVIIARLDPRIRH